MAKYHGGPFDGMQFFTRYDHLPVIRIPYPRDPVMWTESIEHYELRRGGRFHIASEPYVKPGMTTTDEARRL